MNAELDGDLCARLVLTLAHFVWQGAALGLLAAVAMLILRRASARARYGVLMTSLLLMALSLPLTFAVLGEGPTPQMELPYVEVPVSPMGDAWVMPPMKPEETSETESSTPAFTEKPLMLVVAKPQGTRVDWRNYAPHVTVAYLLGVALMLLRAAAALGGGRRLRRRSEPVDDPALLESLARQAKALGLRFTPAAAYCRRVAVPTVVGVVRPAILLPLSLVTALTPQQVDLLLLHELAHIRRYDPLLNVLQRLIEAVLFFHPAVWYVSHRIRIEREHCCDDLVAALGGAQAYAESLVAAAALAHGTRAASAGLAAIDRPSHLRQRIARLLGKTHPRVRLMRGGWLMAALAAPLLALAVVQAAPSEEPPLAPVVPEEAVSAEPTSEDAQVQVSEPKPTTEGVEVSSDAEPAPDVPASEEADVPKPRQRLFVGIGGVDKLDEASKKEVEAKLTALARDPGLRETVTRELVDLLQARGMPEMLITGARDVAANMPQVSGVEATEVVLGRPNAGVPYTVVAGSYQYRYEEFVSQDGTWQPLNAEGDPRHSGTQTPLIKQLGDPDWWLRKVAAQQLGEEGHPGNAEPLISALKDEDKRVQAAAAEALGKLRRPSSIKHLVAALKDGEPVREAAAEALTKFDSTEVMPLVRLAAQDSELEVWKGAVAALARLKTPEALDVLVAQVPRVSQKPMNLPRNRPQSRDRVPYFDAATLAKALSAFDPSRVAEALSAAAKSEDPDMRQGAVHVLRQLDTGEADQLLASQLDDESREVRRAAVESIADKLSQAAENNAELPTALTEALGKALHDPDLRLRDAAVKGISGILLQQHQRQQASEPRLVEALRVALRDRNGLIAQGAALSLNQINWEPPTKEDMAWFGIGLGGQGSYLRSAGDAAFEPLLQALNADLTPVPADQAGPGPGPVRPGPMRPMSQLRTTAAQGLGQLKDPRATPALVDALNDPHAASSAAWALGEIGDPAAVEALAAALQSEQADLRWNAVEALKKIGDKRATGPLVELLKREQVAKFREPIVEALAALEDPEAVPALMELLTDQDRNVSSSAARALRDIKDARAVPALTERLLAPDEDWSTRKAAAEALGEIGDPSAAEALGQAARRAEELEGPQLNQELKGQLRDSLIEALGKLGEAGVKPLVELVKQSENPETRVQAAAALGATGNAAAIQPLAEAVRLDPSGEVSAAAAHALGGINDPQAVKALREVFAAEPNENRWDAIFEGLALSPVPSATDTMAELMEQLKAQALPQGPELMLTLAQALAERSDERARPVLEKLSQNPGTRVQAEAALAKLGERPPAEMPENKAERPTLGPPSFLTDENSGATTVFLDVTAPDGGDHQNYRIQPGEDFAGGRFTLLEIVGQNEGIRIRDNSDGSEFELMRRERK